MVKSPISRHSTTFRDDKLLADLDSDSVGDGKVALLKQSCGHAAVLEHCIAVLHQFARLFHLDGVLKVQTIKERFEKETHR